MRNILKQWLAPFCHIADRQEGRGRGLPVYRRFKPTEGNLLDGSGRAAVGGLGGVALWVGGKGGRVDTLRAQRGCESLVALDRAIRSTDLDIASILLSGVMCEVKTRSSSSNPSKASSGLSSDEDLRGQTSSPFLCLTSIHFSLF